MSEVVGAPRVNQASHIWSPGNDPPTRLAKAQSSSDTFARDSSVRAVTRAADLKRELVLKWSDEFDGPIDSAPNPQFWTHDVGGDGWGNKQLEFDTNSTKNASLDGDGRLRITARREPFEGKEFTSARIKTQNRVTALYGRIEASIKLPPGQGLWPAFWMLGENIDTVGWPECCEVDIMEYRGQEKNKALGTIHGPGYSGEHGISKTFTLPTGGFDESFHRFTVDWDPSSIVFSVDGEPYHTITRDEVMKHGRWGFDQPFFLILNLAVGGGFVGSPDASTPFPATMLVDYVRVYEKRPIDHKSSQGVL